MKKVVFLGMGGTIAGRAVSSMDNVGYTAAELELSALLESVTGLEDALHGFTLVSEQVAQFDSKDMTHAGWHALATRVISLLEDSEVSSLIVTHGTDTLEETAYFLSQVVPTQLQRTKVIVLTCAMRPASSAYADGPRNLVDAAIVSNAPGACGVVAVCAGQVHEASAVYKDHPYRLSAFSSGEFGILGVVEEGQYRPLRPWPLPPSETHLGAIPLPKGPWPRVELVMSHAGADGTVVRSLCAYGSSSPLRGIVVVGTGNGTVHQDLMAALQGAVDMGVQVALTTRCQMGSIVGTPRGVGRTMTVMHLSPVKARIALMLNLMGP